MESRFSLLFVLVLLIAIPRMGHGHAALLPKLYWESMLPSCPMPKALNDLVQQDFLFTLKSQNGKPLPLQLHPTGLRYSSHTSEHRHHPNISSLFFLDCNLRVGTNLKVTFPKTNSTTKSPFLIREVAETYPFSSNRLFEILAKFMIKRKTVEARLIEKTIKDCEVPGIRGEETYCTTSLESMVDLGTTKMGKEVMALSTTVEEGINSMYWKISSVVKKSHSRLLVCHKTTYPYAVFYCHSAKGLRVYKVGLTGTGKNKANAIAICHDDTSAWNPNHLAFQVLKVKPGNIPICHFLPQDDVVCF